MRFVLLTMAVSLLFIICPALGHGVDDNTRAFLLENTGVQFFPFMYIGAKHMLTGYDHLLFLFGVLFLLFKKREVILYVSMFTLGHSTTLFIGVLGDIQVNAYLIDAIIGLSVIYKGFDNIGGFKRCFDWQPDTRVAVLMFGLFHGFGLATKLQEFAIPEDGLLVNLLAFNLGVELGQLLALMAMLLLITALRKSDYFFRFSLSVNTVLMSAGLTLMGYQLTGLVVNY